MILPIDIGLPSKFREFRSYPGFSQWDIASQLASSDKRFSGLAAPTGTGKSLLAFTTSQLLDTGRTLYLTTGKNLQSQLVSDFSGSDNGINLYSLVGHSAHKCTNPSFDAHGEILDIECSERNGDCPYWASIETSLLHSNITTNYANWISIAKANDPQRFGKFDLLICDEAHNLETLLCDLLSIRIYPRSVFDLIGITTPTGITSGSIITWISWAKENITRAISTLDTSKREDRQYSSRESTRTKRLRKLCQNLITIADIQCDWVVEKAQSGFGQSAQVSSFTLTPVFAADYAEEWLFRGIPRIILSSATITEDDFYYLGIKPKLPVSDSEIDKQYDFHDIESGFDAAKRPFIYWPTTNIDYQMVDGQLIQVCRRIDQIIESRQRLGWNGIIHSISYKYASLLSEHCESDIMTHTSRDAQSTIRAFLDTESRPNVAVLASPVIGEGIDFANDLARYQIIFKVPSIDSRNPLIAARKKRDSRYANYLRAKSILQYTGRVCRSERDFGETFILDRHWGNWMMNAVEWPRYFKKSWRRVSMLPEPIKPT